MTVIFITGGPCSGRSTTAKTLHDYLIKHMPDMQIALIGKQAGLRYSESDTALAVYRHVAEQTANIIIIDGVGHNVFSRRQLMDSINSAASIHQIDVEYLAIEHRRTDGFMYSHNEDEGHRPYSNKRIREILTTTQQPVVNEGIASIYRVTKANYFNLVECLQIFNEYAALSIAFPIVEEADETKGNGDTDE